MSNNNLYRFAGWSAILSIVFSFAMFGLVGEGRNAVFIAVSIIASVFTAIVLYGLYVFHRSQSAVVSLVMLACGVIGLVLENLGTGPEGSLFVLTNGIYSVAFLLIGYLGFGNAIMPRWLAILAYVCGLATLGMAGAFALGQPDLGENVFGMFQFLAWVVWSIGICRLFLSSKLAMAMRAA